MRATASRWQSQVFGRHYRRTRQKRSTSFLFLSERVRGCSFSPVKTPFYCLLSTGWGLITAIFVALPNVLTAPEYQLTISRSWLVLASSISCDAYGIFLLHFSFPERSSRPAIVLTGNFLLIFRCMEVLLPYNRSLWAPYFQLSRQPGDSSISFSFLLSILIAAI